MKVNTRIFGEIDITDDKIITFENGIIGFPDLKLFTLLHDEEKGSATGLRYLQSLDEPGFAMPVIDPLKVKEEYAPSVNEELLASLGELNQDNVLVLVTISVPSDLTKMTVNLQGPFIINADSLKGCQIVVEGNDYPVKFPVYEILQARKAGV